MEAIQFTEAERIWSETTLELGTIAKSLMGNQEEVTAGNFIGTQLVENPNFDQNIPGDSSPVLGNELVQNGSFEEIGTDLVTNGDFSDGETGWNFNSNWSAPAGTANADGTSNADINQGTTLAVVGKSYKIIYEVVSISQGEFFFKFGGVNGTLRNEIGVFTEIVKAVNTNRISLDGNYNVIGSVTNISVQQLDPNDYWTLGTGWIIGENEVVREGATGNSQITQSISIEAGSTYIISYTRRYISGDGQTNFYSEFITDGVSKTLGNYDSQVQESVVVTDQFRPTYSGSLNLQLYGISTFNGSTTNISVKQIIAVDVDLWTTRVPNIESSVKFTEGKATIDYDSDGTPQGECGINQVILSVGKFYNVEVDFKLITGTARLYCGSNFVTLTGTAKRTYSLRCEGTSKLSIVRSSNTSDTKIELYSVNAYESTNLVVNGTGSDSVGLSGNWSVNNSTIESDTINGGINVTLTDSIGFIGQTISTVIGTEYRLYVKGTFGDVSSFAAWNAITGGASSISTDGVSFIDFTATGTTTVIRTYVSGSAGQFINVTDINCSPTTPFDLGSNWDLQAGTGLVANGYGNNNAVESFTAVAGQTYRVEYKVSSYTQGSVRVQIGGTNGTANASVGTFVENLIATNTGDIDIQNVQVGGLNFIGVIDYIKIQSGEQSDTLDMTDQDPKAIWITGGGNLKVTDMSGTTSTINNLPNDKFIDWLRIRKIWLTGTTATGIKGIY